MLTMPEPPGLLWVESGSRRCGVVDVEGVVVCAGPSGRVPKTSIAMSLGACPEEPAASYMLPLAPPAAAGADPALAPFASALRRRCVSGVGGRGQSREGCPFCPQL